MSGTNQRLIQANTTLLQPGANYFRLSDALNVQSIAQQASSTSTTTQLTSLNTKVTALETQVATLQAQVQALQLFMNSFNYLQLEVSTGTIFLDQRTIYKRSIIINNALDTALTNSVRAHGIPNINYIVNVQAMAAQQGGPQYPVTFLNMATAPSMSTGVSIWADITNIIVSVGTTAFPNFQVLATLWYTATDR